MLQSVGLAVGAAVGLTVGAAVGTAVGATVGAAVGVAVTAAHWRSTVVEPTTDSSSPTGHVLHAAQAWLPAVALNLPWGHQAQLRNVVALALWGNMPAGHGALGATVGAAVGAAVGATVGADVTSVHVSGLSKLCQ